MLTAAAFSLSLGRLMAFLDFVRAETTRGRGTKVQQPGNACGAASFPVGSSKNPA